MLACKRFALQSCALLLKSKILNAFLQGLRVRVTPIWTLITPQASVFLLELPPEAAPDQASVEAALVSVKQPRAQVLPPPVKDSDSTACMQGGAHGVCSDSDSGSLELTAKAGAGPCRKQSQGPVTHGHCRAARLHTPFCCKTSSAKCSGTNDSDIECGEALLI